MIAGIYTGTNDAHATCSPGIPCTEYDLYDDSIYPAPGENKNYNADKTGIGILTGPVPNFPDLPDINIDYPEVSTSICDGNFMNQIYSKAYMEASRQDIMAQQLIHKPDSVLEYTCYDKFINHAANNAASFSETLDWEERTITLKTDETTKDIEITVVRNNEISSSPDAQENLYEMDPNDGDEDVKDLSEALDYLISHTLENYITNNFAHNYLGDMAAIDNNMTFGVDKSNYDGCTDMALVWEAAKCTNFGVEDTFLSLEDLINYDPRILPEGSACEPTGTIPEPPQPDEPQVTMTPFCPDDDDSPEADTNINYDLIRLSNNCANEDGEHAYVEMDLIELQDYILLGTGDEDEDGKYIPGTGGDEDGEIECGSPIPTGVPIITYELVKDTEVQGYRIGDKLTYFHYEHICLNPGCFYRPVKMDLSTPDADGNLPTIPPFDDGTDDRDDQTRGACIPY